MKFEQLEQEYQDDHLANALYAREVEWFHYEFDRKNFEAMLKGLPEGEYKNSIAKRLHETEMQMGYVDQIYKALLSQLRNRKAHLAAVGRTRAKREAAAEK